METNVKRSRCDENEQMTLPLGPFNPGVGARQAGSPPPVAGGGYQDVCTTENGEKKPRRRDPRLDDLRTMGLQRAWIAVAEAIGVDATLVAWRILDADPQSSYDGTTLRVPLRSWRTYLRYQRNRYIDSLSSIGLPPQEIQRRLQRQLGEHVSLSHIKRLAARR